VSYAHREQVWRKRAAAVPTGRIPFAEAQGKVAYAAKQAHMYRDLAVRAETTRTEPKLAKGKRRQVYAPTWDTIIPADNDEISNAGNDEGEGDDDAEDDDERGDVDSDEELLMGGEVDED
jgi:hypothetical protein